MKFRSESEVILVSSAADDNNVAMSAWVSFGNDDMDRLKDRDGVAGLINFLYKNHHMTPFESSVFTFRVQTPIFVAREFFRHRTASYNEWSGRYSQMLPEFYLPPPERPTVQAGKPGDYYFVQGDTRHPKIIQGEYEHVCGAAWDAYQHMLTAGIAKEVARNVLPLNTYTYFYVTMNARNLMHFLTLRNDSHALYEIREVAGKMEEIFAGIMPITHRAFKEHDWRTKDEQLDFLNKRVKQLEAEMTYY